MARCCSSRPTTSSGKPEESPNPGHGHHEFGNAETYFLVGDALGKGMIKLLDVGDARPRGDGPPASQARTPSGTIEGWTVRVDDRLLAPPNDALGSARAAVPGVQAHRHQGGGRREAAGEAARP